MNPQNCPKIKHMLKHIVSLIFNNKEGDEYGIFKTYGREER